MTPAWPTRRGSHTTTPMSAARCIHTRTRPFSISSRRSHAITARRPRSSSRARRSRTQQLAADSDAFAAALAGLGVRHGDRVALVLPNCPQFLIGRVRRLEGGRHRRSPQSDLYRARARARARSDAGARRRCRSRPSTGGSKRSRRRPRCDLVDRHLDQGTLSARAAPAVHAVQGKEGRPPHLARRGRPVAPGSARSAPGPARAPWCHRT